MSWSGKHILHHLSWEFLNHSPWTTLIARSQENVVLLVLRMWQQFRAHHALGPAGGWSHGESCQQMQHQHLGVPLCASSSTAGTSAHQDALWVPPCCYVGGHVQKLIYVSDISPHSSLGDCRSGNLSCGRVKKRVRIMLQIEALKPGVGGAANFHKLALCHGIRGGVQQ